MAIALTVVLAVYASMSGTRALFDAATEEQNAVAMRTLAQIQSGLTPRVDAIISLGERPRVVQMLTESNRTYRNRPDAARRSAEQDTEWRSAMEPTVSMTAVMNNDLSKTLRREFIEFYAREHGMVVFNQVVITDAAGLIVAQSGQTRAYDMSREEWWRGARDDRIYFGTFTSDPITGDTGLPVAVNITGDTGEFLGVIMAMLGSDAVIQSAADVMTSQKESRVKVLLPDGRLVYSSRVYRFMENVADTDLFQRLNGGDNSGRDSGNFTVTEGGSRILYSFARANQSSLHNMLSIVLLIGADVATIQSSLRALRFQILIGAAIAVIIGTLVALFISRRITDPVKSVSTAALRIAKGDLNTTVEVKSRDEIGALASAFTEMNSALTSIAEMMESVATGDLTATVEQRGEHDRLGKALEEMQRNLRQQIGQIVDAGLTLTASVSQISSFSSQLAAGASQNAAAVSETTAIVEEVKQTAQLSNEKSQEVSRLAQDTVEVSRRGEESVEQSRDVMERIKQQMEDIGRSIMSLSEQSQAIGEIIMSVGELSDQSNLLAVNAAIEASRAGDQGKGFTVVAQEIRSLAEQSKKATQQVRGLLNDIQNATNAAVLSMEQGGKAMEEGLRQSNDSGEAIKRLTGHIERAAEAATQIAASSRQQLAGMDQVAAAMENIKEVTEQNVESTRRMETEMQSLDQVGQDLNKMVNYYRTE